MTGSSPYSRRTFLQKSAAAATAALALPTIVPSSVGGANGQTAPSNRIAVGFIGTGSHGTDWNLPPYLKHQSARVVAVCDVDKLHLARVKGMVNRHYQNEDCFATTDFRKVLARKDIDAVMISTPDHWHTLISLFAIQAGKDVQCEKPTLTQVHRHGRLGRQYRLACAGAGQFAEDPLVRDWSGGTAPLHQSARRAR